MFLISYWLSILDLKRGEDVINTIFRHNGDQRRRSRLREADAKSKYAINENKLPQKSKVERRTQRYFAHWGIQTGPVEAL